MQNKTIENSRMQCNNKSSTYKNLSHYKLQRIRQEYMDIESEYLEKKGSYDKVAVGFEMDKLALEKECDTFQVFILSYFILFYLILFVCCMYCCTVLSYFALCDVFPVFYCTSFHCIALILLLILMMIDRTHLTLHSSLFTSIFIVDITPWLS